MAVIIYTLDKPWIWVEAVAGGSLPESKSFYFITFNAFCPFDNGAYYGYVPGKASNQMSCVTTAVNKKIKMEIYEKGGGVVSYSNVGGGIVRVQTDIEHGLSNGVSVYLRGTVNYTGKYTISNASGNLFDITATWVVDDGASYWYNTPGIPDEPTGFNGNLTIYHKWDYYSMLRGDGTKFQWLNTNNPMFSSEWRYPVGSDYNNYGHSRWGGSYYYYGAVESYLTTAADGSKFRYFDSVTIDNINHQWNTTTLWERSTNGSVCSRMAHPEIAMRKYSDSAGTTVAYSLPVGMLETESAALIYITNSDYLNQWRYVAAAIKAGGIIGKSALLFYDRVLSATSSDDYYNQKLILRGCICSQSATFSTPIEWYDKNFTFIHGRVGSGNLSSAMIQFTSSYLFFERLNDSYWNNPHLSVKNTRIDVNGDAYVYDNIKVIANFTPYNTTTYQGTAYEPLSGYIIYGALWKQNNYTQMIRYPDNNDYIRNTKLNYCSMITTPSSYGTPQVFEMTEIEFAQIQNDAANQASGSIYNFDIALEYNNTMAGYVFNKVWNCYNVTSLERSNKLIRILFRYSPSSTPPDYGVGSIFMFNFFFNIDIKVMNSAGSPISGASVSIINSAAVPNIYTASTGADGTITTQNVKCYTVEYDPLNTDGYTCGGANYKFWSKTTLMNNIVIRIKKEGYEPYLLNISQVSSAKNLIFSLKRESVRIDQEQASL
jgi:hypothetical protein